MSFSGASGQRYSFSNQAVSSEANRAALLRFAEPELFALVGHLRPVEERVVADANDEGVRDRGCGPPPRPR